MSPALPDRTVAFIGGGNMASALIGGLIRDGMDARQLRVVEPHAPQREALWEQHRVFATPVPDSSIAGAALVVWAVKPQAFDEAARTCGVSVAEALHLSVMAGVRIDTIAATTHARRVVRAMPNTPALIGRGITGLHAGDAVSTADRAWIDAVLRPTGSTVWVASEADLDAVTAVSGSGPAYVLYLLEAMIEAGTALGLTREQARVLSQATIAGTAELAARSDEPPAMLRARVTSKGGTTAAAIDTLDRHAVQAAFVEAIGNARRRARELGAG